MSNLGVYARRWNVADWLAAALLSLTALRMLVICVAHPIVGYANNLDFFRQSACVGLWQAYIQLPVITAHLQGPVDDLIRSGARLPTYCMRSSDNLFPWLAAHFYAKHAHLQLRLVGTLKALIALGFIITITCQTSGARMRLVVATYFYLLFGDIVVLAYFNTLYVDASGLISAGLIAMLILISAQNRPERGWHHCVTIAACLLWLGTVKPQYSGLALLLSAISTCVYVFLKQDRRRGLLVAAAGIAGVVAFSALNGSASSIMRGVAQTNTADSLLGAILPETINRRQALDVLGLPESCLAAIGLDAYRPEVAQHKACPEIRTAQRWKLIPLFFEQPGAFVRAMHDGINGRRPTSPQLPYLDGSLANAAWQIRLIASTSLSTWISRLPTVIYESLVVLPCLFGAATGLFFVLSTVSGGRKWPGSRTDLCAAPALGGFVIMYVIVSTVLGDGFVELPRHEAGMLIGFALVATGAGQILVRALIAPVKQLRSVHTD